MDTQKVRSPIKQNVLAGAAQLFRYTYNLSLLQELERVVCFLSLYYDYIAVAKSL